MFLCENMYLPKSPSPNDYNYKKYADWGCRLFVLLSHMPKDEDEVSNNSFISMVEHPYTLTKSHSNTICLQWRFETKMPLFLIVFIF